MENKQQMDLQCGLKSSSIMEDRKLTLKHPHGEKQQDGLAILINLRNDGQLPWLIETLESKSCLVLKIWTLFLT